MVYNIQSKLRILTFLIVFLFISGCSRDVNALQTAPDFILPDLSGNLVSLKQYKGNIVLLDFWATWCPPCRISIPELVKLQEKYRDQGVVILGISMDDPNMFDNGYLLAFKKKFKMNYKILRATMQVANDYFGTMNMALPTMSIINREGKVVEKHVGFAPGAVEKSVKKLL